MQILIIFSVAFIASLLSSMSGAGAAMLTTPVWISLGFSLPVAITSNLMNGSAWTLIAARNYLRGISLDFKLLGWMVGFGLAGAYCGTFIIRLIEADTLKRVIGLIIISLVLVVAFKPQLGKEESAPRLSKFTTGLLAFPLGAYESFFGSGNGIFSSILLAKSRGFKLTSALGYYYMLAFVWNCFAVSIYISHGFGNLSLMIPSTVGSVLGAYFGSRFGRRGGYKLVRILFLIMGGLLGFKLAFGI